MLAQRLSSPVAWVIIGVLWVAVAFNAAWSLRRSGRRWWVWFIISVFFSVVPAAIVAYADYFRQLSRHRAEQDLIARGLRRCPHCGQPFETRKARRAGGLPVCPHCEMTFDDTTIA